MKLPISRTQVPCAHTNGFHCWAYPQHWHLLLIIAWYTFAVSVPMAQEATIRVSVADAAKRHFFAAGPDGERFVLEWSTNLLVWEAAATNYLFGPDAPVLFYEPAFPDRTFYRARRYEPPQTCSCNEGSSPGAGCPFYGPPDDPAVRDRAIPNDTTPIATIRLFFHILAENDGSNQAVPAAQLEAQVQTLNDHFRPYRLQFVHEARILPHSTFRHPRSEEELLEMRRAYSISPSTRLNVFITAMPGDKYGISTYPWDPAALTKDGGIVITLLRCRGGEALLTHEIGHALGLWHTHHGSDEIEIPRCHECWERASSSLSARDRTGDRCSDTLPGLLNEKGESRGGVDVCSNTPWPLSSLNNFMSAYPSPVDRFTPQQAGRMHGWFKHVLGGWVDNITPASPSELAVEVTPFGEVILTWIDNAWNETTLAIERAEEGGRFTEIIRMSANASLFTDLAATPSARVSYRLRALNGDTPSYYSPAVAVLTSAAPENFLVDFRNVSPPFLGSESDPFQTIAQAFAAAPANSARKVTVQAGTYRTAFPANPPPARFNSRGGTVIFEKP